MTEDRELRDVLGRFATGVAVVTAQSARGERAGVTINSFSSLSLSPRLVLFSLARSLLSLSVFEEAESYALNFLASDQEDLSRRFAARGADKWDGSPFSVSPSGIVLLDGAIAHLECSRRQTFDVGDHRLFICMVTNFSPGEPKRPLLYFMGRYRDLAPESAPFSYNLTNDGAIR